MDSAQENTNATAFEGESEETLSFCNLVMDESQSGLYQENLSEGDRISSASQDFFEFFQQESTASTCRSRSESIVFCGKLIEPKGKPSKDYGIVTKQEHSRIVCSTKPKWYSFVFGVGRFPTEINLGDMKMRQRRRRPAAKLKSNGSGRGKGLRGLLSILFAL